MKPEYSLEHNPSGPYPDSNEKAESPTSAIVSPYFETFFINME